MKMLRELKQDRVGFTLMELVVVLAIIGVLAAVSVPLITQYLGESKKEAYNAEQDTIQAAVDAFYSASDNTRFIGKRQYPIIGRAQTNQATLTVQIAAISLLDNGDPFTAQDHDANAGTATVELWNPIGGTEGSDISLTWTDVDTDGVRDTGDKYAAVSVTRGGVAYKTDARYFFIDFEALVTKKLLEAIPQSASTDNKPESSASTYTGSYSWYIDNNGKVKSLSANLPSATGYVSGVFP